MNYQRIYQLQLIDRARIVRELQIVERHHVIPKCLGGSDEDSNIVCLTPSEHYVAHQLLCKLYPLSGELAYAMLMMAYGGSKVIRTHVAYAWVRRRASDARRGKKRILSDEARAKMAAGGRSQRGSSRASPSAATKLKMSLAHKGKVHSVESRERMSVAAKESGRRPPSQLGKTWRRT